MPPGRPWTLPKLPTSSSRRDWRLLHIYLSLHPSRPRRPWHNLLLSRSREVRDRKDCRFTASLLLGPCINKQTCLNSTKLTNNDHKAKVLYRITLTMLSVTQSGTLLSESLSSVTPRATASTLVCSRTRTLHRHLPALVPIGECGDSMVVLIYPNL